MVPSWENADPEKSTKKLKRPDLIRFFIGMDF